MTFLHESVLLKEAIDGLAIKENGIYIDATFGRGGHSQAILEKLAPNGRLIAIDLDPQAIAVSKQAPFVSDSRFEIEQCSFDQLESIVSKREWLGKVDGILFDLGVSSPQLDDPSRGFSFMKEGPLDMRMNPDIGMSAAEWIALAKQSEIANVIYQYGEERFSRRIASAIVRAREESPIETTTQLANIIASAMPKKEKHKHPATRSFQAIRIFINQELRAISNALSQVLDVLAIGGRLCVISFHSLEDRVVKQFIQRQVKGDDFPPDLPILPDQINQRFKKIGKMIKASDAEIEQNPRARSACLRIAEKIA